MRICRKKRNRPMEPGLIPTTETRKMITIEHRNGEIRNYGAAREWMRDRGAEVGKSKILQPSPKVEK